MTDVPGLARDPLHARCSPAVLSLFIIVGFTLLSMHTVFGECTPNQTETFVHVARPGNLTVVERMTETSDPWLAWAGNNISVPFVDAVSTFGDGNVLFAGSLACPCRRSSQVSTPANCVPINSTLCSASAGAYSQVLLAHNWDFDPPLSSSETLLGIEAVLGRGARNPNTSDANAPRIFDSIVQFINASNVTSTNYASAQTISANRAIVWPESVWTAAATTGWTAFPVYATGVRPAVYGGPNDVWGIASSFGADELGLDSFALAYQAVHGQLAPINDPCEADTQAVCDQSDTAANTVLLDQIELRVYTRHQGTCINTISPTEGPGDVSTRVTVAGSGFLSAASYSCQLSFSLGESSPVSSTVVVTAEQSNGSLMCTLPSDNNKRLTTAFRIVGMLATESGPAIPTSVAGISSFDYLLECPNNCSGNGDCNTDTGQCECALGYLDSDCGRLCLDVATAGSCQSCLSLAIENPGCVFCLETMSCGPCNATSLPELQLALPANYSATVPVASFCPLLFPDLVLVYLPPNVPALDRDLPDPATPEVGIFPTTSVIPSGFNPDHGWLKIPGSHWIEELPFVCHWLTVTNTTGEVRASLADPSATRLDLWCPVPVFLPPAATTVVLEFTRLDYQYTSSLSFFFFPGGSTVDTPASTNASQILLYFTYSILSAGGLAMLCGFGGLGWLLVKRRRERQFDAYRTLFEAPAVTIQSAFVRPLLVSPELFATLESKLSDYRALNAMLLNSPKYALPYAILETLPRLAGDDVARALTFVFSQTNALTPFLVHAVQRHTEQTDLDFNTFRVKSPTAKLWGALVQLPPCISYVHHSLAQVLYDLCSTYAATPLVVDPDSETADKLSAIELVENTYSFLASCQVLFDVMTNGTDTVPPHMRVVLHYAAEAMSTKYTPAHGQRAIGSLMFLRLFVPVLSQPTSFGPGLLPFEPPEHVSALLFLLARIFLTLANNSTFMLKHETLTVFNEFLDSNRARFDEWCAELVRLPDPAVVQEAREPIDADQGVITVSYAMLYAHIIKNHDTIIAKMEEYSAELFDRDEIDRPLDVSDIALEIDQLRHVLGPPIEIPVGKLGVSRFEAK